MAVSIVRVTDKNFRITIPDDLRTVEGIKQGDFIQIEITKVNVKEDEIKKIDELVNVISKLITKIDKMTDR